MDVTYQRELNETWILLPEEEPAEEYSCRLLEQNRCRHLLRLSRRQSADGCLYAFAISRGNSLARLYQLSPLSFPALRQLLLGVLQAVEEAESCLLELHHLVLQPELIFASPDMDNLRFCCHPGYRRDFFEQLRELMRYCVQKIDHRDPGETETVYRLLEICEQEYYRFEDLLDVMGQACAARLTESGMPRAPLTPEPEQRAPAVRTPARRFEETAASAASAPFWRRWIALALLLLLTAGAGLLLIAVRKYRGYWDWRLILFGLLSAAAAGILAFRSLLPRPEPVEEDVPKGSPEASPPAWADEAPPAAFPGETTVLSPDMAPVRGIWQLIPLRRSRRDAVVLNKFPFTVGKLTGEVDLLLDEASVSRIHARIEQAEGQFVIVDCRSTNGTWVNGIRLRPEERYPLREGDELRFAELSYRLEHRQ